MQLRVNTQKLRPKELCRQPAHPLIKIAGNNSPTAEPRRIEYVLGEHLVNLFASLEERGPHVYIRQVNGAAGSVHFGPEKAPGLAASNGDVEVAVTFNRKTAERSVAVISSAMFSVLAEAEMKSKFFCDEFGLIITPMQIRMAYDLLQGDNVRVDLPKHIDDPLGRISTVDPYAFMNVVSGDLDRVHQLLR